MSTMLVRTCLQRFFVLLLALVAAASASAADPRPETPGWYSTQIGRFTVTALWDGTLDMPVDKVFKHPGPTQLKALLARAGEVETHQPHPARDLRREIAEVAHRAGDAVHCDERGAVTRPLVGVGQHAVGALEAQRLRIARGERGGGVDSRSQGVSASA